MKSISIINFKGGVGKTTLSLHLSCYLARTSKVLLIDVDHQSSLSIIVLGADRWLSQIEDGNTVNKIFESFSNRRITPANDEIIFKDPFNGPKRNQYGNLDLVSAQFELDDTEIDLASTNIGNAALSDWEKRTLLSTWLDSIDAESKYDYVIIDCPPATKIVSQNAIAASDGYVIPVIPDELSSRGVTHFESLVKTKIDDKLEYLRTSARVPTDQVPKNYKSGTQMVAIVPFLVKQAGQAASGMTNIHTEQLSALRREWGTAVLNEVGKNYIGLPEAINAGWPIWDYEGRNATRSVKKMMEDICMALKDRIDKL